MNISTLLISISATLLLAACGSNTPEVPKGEISQNRTTAFKKMMPDFAIMGKMVKGEEAFDEAKFRSAAAAFSEHAKKPFEFFESDPQGNGDALSDVWDKPQEFAAAREQFLQAVENLNTAAQTAKLDELKTAYSEVGASCKSCHDSFRRPK
ncbi:MAG: cytochrome c [Neisseria sp.]|nr:cytochrome c [Neisseria sp.]